MRRTSKWRMRNRKGEESGARERGQQEEEMVAEVVIMEIRLIIITETILN
jgi:hypothetical protein